MSGVKHILFPVDFSARCEESAPAVRAWAEQLHTRLTLLHAVSIPVNIELDFSAQLYNALQEDLRGTAERKMREFLRRHFAGQPADTVICEGDAGTAITGWASRQKQVLIMMPTHGHGAFRRFLVGSVTARVLHDATSPVWTAVHKPNSRPATGRPRRILCGVDRVRAAVPLLRWAARLAAQTGAQLRLVHVLPAVDETSRNRGEKAVRRFWAERARQELAPLLRAAGAEDILLRGGPIAKTLAETAAELRADLLLIGRGHLKKNLGRLRTHSMGIVCKSPCPVISV